MSSNIEKFDLLVAKLLAELYEQFPVAKGIAASVYGIDVENIFLADGKVDEKILRELDFFCCTVRWLKQAGYIDYTTEYDSGSFSGAVLTAKALEILKITPESLRSPQPLGDYLIANVRSGTTEALKKGVTAAFSAGATFVWKALAQ